VRSAKGVHLGINTGSLPMFAAIRRASSLLSNLAAILAAMQDGKLLRLILFSAGSCIRAFDGSRGRVEVREIVT
jgi:hypothetical protein